MIKRMLRKINLPVFFIVLSGICFMMILGIAGSCDLETNGANWWVELLVFTILCAIFTLLSVYFERKTPKKAPTQKHYKSYKRVKKL